MRKKAAAKSAPKPAEQSVGTILWTSRTQQGYDLSDIAAYLKIRHNYLEAIENDQFQELPSGAFVQGYLKTYAQFLSLDHDMILSRYEEQTGRARKADVRTTCMTPQPVQQEHLPKYVMVSISLALFVACYLAWMMWQGTQQAQVTANSPVPMPDEMQAYFEQFQPVIESGPLPEDEAPEQFGPPQQSNVINGAVTVAGPNAVPGVAPALNAPAANTPVDTAPKPVDNAVMQGNAPVQAASPVPQAGANSPAAPQQMPASSPEAAPLTGSQAQQE
jgi:cytoskeletal protein RodZ